MKTMLVAAAYAAFATSSAGAVVFDTDFSDATMFPDVFKTSVHAVRTKDDSERDVVRLTPNQTFKRGGLFTTEKTSLGDNASFSTRFLLNMNHRNGNTVNSGGDGIVFVVAANNNQVGGNGNGIGYAGIKNSIGIEFDTIDNKASFNDLTANHVAINQNGEVSPALAYRDVPTSFIEFDSGVDIWAWVDYDGTTDLLSLRIATTNDRPLEAYLSTVVDLPTILGQTEAYFGFTSGTGYSFNNHDVVNWRLDAEYNPIGLPDVIPDPEVPGATDVPAPAALGLMGLGVLGIGARRRRR